MDKLKGKKNSEFLISFLKDYLNPFFENIDFDIQIHQFGTVFFVKEVQIKKDVFKRMGIPLNLREGKVSEIKLSIGNLMTLTPIELEITGIIIEVNSIYLSKNYQSELISIKEQLLYKWDTIHKAIFKKKQGDNSSYIELMLLNAFNHLKIQVHSCRLIMVDNATISPDKKIIKKLELKISEIFSKGILTDKENQRENELNDCEISREILIEKLSVNILKQCGDEYEAINISDYLIQPIDIQIFIKQLFKALIKKSQIELSITIVDPLIMNISKEKIHFIENLSNYFIRTNKVEKYWIYRPEVSKIQSQGDAVEWLRYAYKSVLTELRKKKRKDNLTYWLEDAVNIERYTNYYKTSRILLDNNNTNSKIGAELKEIENHMPLENILHCRQWVFQKLIDNKDYENIKKIINKYSPFDPKMWLTFSRFSKRKEDEIIDKITKEKLVLDLTKGSPLDITVSLNINANCVLINFNRKVKNHPMNNTNELPEQLRYYYLMYKEVSDQQLKSIINKENKEENMLHFFKWINQLQEGSDYDYLTEAVCEEMKLIANNSIEGRNSANITPISLGHNQVLLQMRPANIINNNSPSMTNPSKYLHLNFNNNNQNDQSSNITNEELLNNSHDQLLTNLIEQYSKKKLRKTLLTILFTNITIDFKKKRNDDIFLDTNILSFNVIDHNFSFIIANTDNSSLLNSIFDYRFNGGSIENYPFANEQEACDGIIVNYLFESLNESKIRSLIFNDSFLKDELDFLNQFDYQFKFSKANLYNSTNNALLIDIFTNILVKYLYRKDLLTPLIELVEKRLENKNQIKCLFNSDGSNFKSGFIMRLADKAINKFSIFSPSLNVNAGHKNATHTRMTINYELMKENNEEEINPELFCKTFSSIVNIFLQDDFQTLFKIIYLNLIKYIISPLLPYYTSDSKSCETVNASLNIYAKIIKKKSFTKDNPSFAKISLLKKSITLRDEDSINKEHIPSNINISMHRSISVNLSNETIAELITLLPNLINSTSAGNHSACSGNIYEDLTITNMDVYDKFVDLKNEYFADYQEDEHAMMNNIEMSYIENRLDLIKQISNSKFHINLHMSQANIHIFDKVFFISTDLCSSINIQLNNIIITNEQLKSLPIIELKAFTMNTNKNKINPDLLMKLFYKTKLNIERLLVKIDMKEEFLETNFSIGLHSSLWNNIYFLPDLIADIHSSKIFINIPPLILKAYSLYNNMAYYVNLYQKNFGIEKKSVFTQKLKFSKINQKKINSNQVGTYTKHIEKLLYYDENVFPLKYYLINRLSSSLFYSVGNHFGETEGIVITVKVDDKKENIEDVFLKYLKPKNCFSIEIPFFLFNSRESLFYEENQVWISSIKTNEAQQERFLQKLKVTYNKTVYNFTYIELLFCNAFIHSIGYLNKNPNVKTLDFTNPKLLFNNDNYYVEELNKVVSKKTFYYEETDLKYQYKKIFSCNDKYSNVIRRKKEEEDNDNNCNVDKDESNIKSNLALNIEKVSVTFIGKNNKDLYLLIYNFRIYQNLCGDLLDGMLLLKDDNELIASDVKKIIKSQQPTNISLHNDNNLSNNNNTLPRKDCESNTVPYIITGAHALNSRIIIDETEEEASQITSTKPQNDEAIFRKHSMHTINFHIKKISFKFLYDLSYTMSSLGIMLYIRDIHYSENIESKIIERVNNSIALLSSSTGMNYFFIESIKCLISLPSFFGNRDDYVQEVDSSKIKLFDSDDMLKLFDKIQSEDNKLFVLIIQNILLEQNQEKMTFKINKAFKLGLLKRPLERIHEKSIVSFEDNIISIINNSDLDRISEYKCYSELDYLYNASGNKISNDKYRTKSCIELIIEKPIHPLASSQGLYTYIQTLESYQRKEKQKIIESMLFGQLMSMLSILREVFNANPKYKVDLSLGVLFIEIPSSLLSYAYYVKNYLQQGKKMISKAFQKRIGKSKFSVKENTPQLIMDQLKEKNIELNRFATEASGLEAHNNQLLKKKTKLFSRGMTRSSIKMAKDGVASLIYIDMPFTAIVFKQLDTNNTMIPFSYFVLIESEAKFIFSDKEIAESTIQIQISDIKWRSNDVRCKEMIIKKGSNKAFKATIHPFKEINVNTPIISISLEAINLVFVFKCLKEIILFFEFNMKIFDENPSKAIMEDMKTNKNLSKYIADIEIMNSAIILPEDSQSANYICINIDKGNIQVKIEDIVPKILLASPDPQIIDTKAIFNAQSIQPDENEFLKHITANIEGSKLGAFFCINGKKEFLAEVEHVTLAFKQPFNDHDLTLLRKIEWEERYQTKVITYKPSLEFKLNGQLKCALGNLLSMKQFMDNNFDEESTVLFLSEPNAMYNNIEMDFVFPTANFNIDLFKCYKDIATEDDVTRIGLQLIGNNKRIDYDNEQPKKVHEEKKATTSVNEKNKFTLKNSQHSHNKSEGLIQEEDGEKTIEINVNSKKKSLYFN